MLLGYVRSISPIRHVRSDAPPFLLIHGTEDPLVPFEQSVKMRECMLAAGAQCELVSIQGGGHGIRGWEQSPALSKYSRTLVDWLEHKLAA
jgi:dipeptidyl aminopeptidase/acylaminoacyl peptidase